jgi:GT2 family glycosyltransferase
MISVIIPNWNGANFLPLCLDSLKNQTERDFEILVVDNCSQDNSRELISKSYPEVRLLALPENSGFPGAVNAGIKEARGDLILLLNNDAEAHPSLLKILKKKAGDYPDAVFFACKVLLYHARDIIDAAGVNFFSDGRITLRGHLEHDSPEYGREAPTFGVHGAAGLYRSFLFQDVGLFDEDFFAYVEEHDLNMRINLRGYDGLFIPEAIVFHVGSGTTLRVAYDGSSVAPGKEEMSFKKPTDYGSRVSDFIAYHAIRNRWFLMLKNFPAGFIIRSFPTMALLELSQFIRWAIIERRFGMYLRCLWDFLKRSPALYGKRREIMKTRKLSVEELLKRAQKVTFMERLADLLKRSVKR